MHEWPWLSVNLKCNNNIVYMAYNMTNISQCARVWYRVHSYLGYINIGLFHLQPRHTKETTFSFFKCICSPVTSKGVYWYRQVGLNGFPSSYNAPYKMKSSYMNLVSLFCLHSVKCASKK